MSLVSGLSVDEDDCMWCWCPACGEYVDVDEDEFVGDLDDGNPEYLVYCPECGQSFYASKSYI